MNTVTVHRIKSTLINEIHSDKFIRILKGLMHKTLFTEEQKQLLRKLVNI